MGDTYFDRLVTLVWEEHVPKTGIGIAFGGVVRSQEQTTLGIALFKVMTQPRGERHKYKIIDGLSVLSEDEVVALAERAGMPD